jgi:hypothetical protein
VFSLRKFGEFSSEPNHCEIVWSIFGLEERMGEKRRGSEVSGMRERRRGSVGEDREDKTK